MNSENVVIKLHFLSLNEGSAKFMEESLHLHNTRFTSDSSKVLIFWHINHNVKPIGKSLVIVVYWTLG